MSRFTKVHRFSAEVAYAEPPAEEFDSTGEALVPLNLYDDGMVHEWFEFTSVSNDLGAAFMRAEEIVREEFPSPSRLTQISLAGEIWVCPESKGGP